MAQHYRRQQLRANLLEMYRNNALRSQSYMDVNRLHHFMALMTEIQTARFEETLPMVMRMHQQLTLFDASRD